MKRENINVMERLSLFCHIAGMISVFMGLVVAFMEILSGEINRSPIGIYVFMTGYGLVKISSTLAKIIYSERSQPPRY